MPLSSLSLTAQLELAPEAYHAAPGGPGEVVRGLVWDLAIFLRGGVMALGH